MLAERPTFRDGRSNHEPPTAQYLANSASFAVDPLICKQSGHDTNRSQEIPHTVTGRVHDQRVGLVGRYQERVSRGEQHPRPRQFPLGDGPQHAESLLGGLGIRNLYVALLIRVDA